MLEDFNNPFSPGGDISDLISGIKKLSIEKGVHFKPKKGLLHLPTNVLERILRELFVRPTHIMPGIIREEIAWGFDPILHYKYQWSEARQEKYETDQLPKIDGKQIQIFWTAVPTSEEARLINSGYNKLTTITKNGQEIQGFIHERKDYGIQIIHRSTISITAISGIAILRSCKQIHELGTAILYGENSFLFDTRCHPPFLNLKA